MKTTTKKTLLSLLALALAAAPLAHGNANTFALATLTESNKDNGTVSILNLTAEAGEPGHGVSGVAGALKTAWWRWTAPSNGFCTADTLGANVEARVNDTVMAVYTGASVNALTRVNSNDDHYLSPGNAGYFSSSTTFYATQGTTYFIAVDGYDADAVDANSHLVSLRLRHLPAVPENRIAAFGGGWEAGINGSLQLSKTAGHAFTAKVNLAGKVYPFSGVFGLDGYYYVSIERKVAPGKVPLPPLTLMIDGAQNGLVKIVSSVGGNMEVSFRTVQRFTAIQPSSMKGLYAATLGNSGTLSTNVSNLGVVTGTAVLGDGTKTTFGSSLCTGTAPTCFAPLYVSLHASAGYYYSYLKFTEAGMTDSLGSGSSYYVRPAKPGAIFYPMGYSYEPVVVGSTYLPPVAGARALGFLDGTMGAGKLSIAMQNPEINPAIMENLTLSSTNLFKFTSPQQRKPVLTLNKANGLVTGSIYDQGGKKRTFTGIVYREGMTTKLKGHMTGTTMCPTFEVIP